MVVVITCHPWDDLPAILPLYVSGSADISFLRVRVLSSFNILTYQKLLLFNIFPFDQVLLSFLFLESFFFAFDL